MSKNVIKTTEKTPELILTILHIASKCMDHFPPYFMFTKLYFENYHGSKNGISNITTSVLLTTECLYVTESMSLSVNLFVTDKLQSIWFDSVYYTYSELE